jgi:hypothetical protein
MKQRVRKTKLVLYTSICTKIWLEYRRTGSLSKDTPYCTQLDFGSTHDRGS